MAEGVDVKGPLEGRVEEVVTDRALGIVARLHRELDETRRELLDRRTERQAELDAGGTLDFLSSTQAVREGDWQVSEAPADMQNRRVEITGPTDRKMVINALNSGAAGFMADFEDSNSPTWANMAGGQVNLADAVRGTIEHDEGDKQYRLNEEVATLLVRPRGWHLPERHVEVDGRPVAGGLFDVALYVAANHQALAEKGSGPYLYVPKLESHLEARLWNDALGIVEEELGLDRGSDQGHRADRDAARGVRDERDPLRAARALGLAERRPVGLHLQRDQALPHPAGLRAARPRRGDHDRALHARLHRAAGQDLPRPRRPRDGRHGGADPLAQGPRGGREGAGQGGRGQGPRGRRRLRRHLGRPPRLGGHRHREVRRGARRPAPPARQAARRRLRRRRRAARHPLHPRLGHRAGAALERERGHPVHLLVAARQRRGRHLRADGGRRHRRDLTRPGVAVDPPRRRAGRRPHGHPRAGPRDGGRGAGDHPVGDRRRRVVPARGPPRPVPRAVRARGAQRRASRSS